VKTAVRELEWKFDEAAILAILTENKSEYRKRQIFVGAINCHLQVGSSLDWDFDALLRSFHLWEVLRNMDQRTVLYTDLYFRL